MVDRRGFLSSFAGVAGALGISPEFDALLTQAPAKLPDSSLYNKDEEGYWTELRKQFLIPPDEIYLNNGTVGSSPRPVLKAVFDAYTDTERMAQ
ncbi:MAG TPA: aminotransferase class V-fold PLP-dependent enzyme, partial [Candidatus Dormibacteraeota bacterium]|nr:aminotransferase class V-fold PLP-dependent enzyme [Candidatus Dormibacteraeota bacterium]